MRSDVIDSRSRRTPPQLQWLLLYLVRFGIGAVLIWSGTAKVERSYDFLSDVYRYELVGPRLGVWVAVIVPWLELVVGGCLLGGILIGGAFLAALLLAGIFTFANVYAIHRGLTISCGCFGAEGDTVGYGTLSRALVLLVAAGIGYLLTVLGTRIPRSADGPRATAGTDRAESAAEGGFSNARAR